MKIRLLLFATILTAVAAALTWQFQHHRTTAGGTGSVLTVYCAAGLKAPVETLAQRFEEETGTAVRLQFGGTATLLSQLRIAGQGDLFIGADQGSLKDADSFGLIAELFPLAAQMPVIAVAQGNPKSIHSVDDLLRDDVKLALSNPEAASIGKITQHLLGSRWLTLSSKATVMKPTVTEIATDLRLGAVDAAIVWDSTVPQFQSIEAVTAPPFNQHREPATAAVLKRSTQPALAIQFARYLHAPDRGAEAFSAAGFTPLPGDPWTERPELVLFSGGVNRPAIEKIVQNFADREGIDITTVFNGCGILCASMKTMGDSSNPKFPDVYYACDVCFVPPVAEHFPEAVLLTETEIGIAVPKGNPKSIQTLADLARPGLRVGLCNAEQSTLGFMTAAMLRTLNLDDSVNANASSQVPTADFLINQMRAGSLDAAVVYKVNVIHQHEHFDFIPFPAGQSKAVQPFAIRKDSKNRALGGRLLAHLRANRDAFEQVGFLWTGDSQAVPSADLEIPDYLRQPSSN